MAIVTIRGQRGGGGGANYSVVGGTVQPVAPKENTIWLNTAVAIPKGKVFFQAAQPDDTTAGAVWIKTGIASTAAFDALKNGDIVKVYPLECKQYASATWGTVSAKSYQNSAWTDWAVYAYNAGNEFVSLTGGWVAPAKENSRLVVVNGTVWGDEASHNTYTDQAIDLTNYSSVIVTGESSGSFPQCSITFNAGTTKNNSSANCGIGGVTTMDVSSLSGLYYFNVYVRNYTSTQRSGYLYISKVELVR